MLSEAEYLRMSFPGVDQDFVDGEIVERTAPDRLHSAVQGNLIEWLGNRETTHHLFAYPELRLRLRPSLVLIPDVSVFWPEDAVQNLPEECPLITIEILSEEDRMTRVLEKLHRYQDWGVKHIWLIDPRRKLLYEFLHGLREVEDFQIPEASLVLTAHEIFE